MNDGNPIDEGEAPRRGPGRPPKTQMMRPDVGHSESDSARIRPEVRTDSAREAEEYARQIIEDGLDHIEIGSELHIDKADWPEGWTYEFKRYSVTGKEDVHNINTLVKQGWRYVPTSRHPELMPSGTKGDAPILIKGLVLMEWPKILTDRAKRRHIEDAAQVLQNSDKQLHEAPPDTMPRDEYPGLVKVKRSFEAPVKPQRIGNREIPAD